MASFTANIPLHCSICPKKPKFSDVSHLLTHIASKGHLSHYYKMQIRSASEEDARQLLDVYNTWYTEWGIEHLMSDCMNLKDRRRTRTRVANARARQATTAPQDSLRRKAVNTQALDPRLTDHMVKNEPRHTPSPHFADRPYPPPVFAPKMNAWQSPFSHTAASFSNTGLEGSDVFTDRSESCSRAVTPPLIDTATLDAGMDNDNGEIIMDATMVSEASKLKGIYWPGMDIFDSATPEMKRKRNQKKDVSVVEQLETNSQEVAATEFIWTPCGTLKKERPISGSVSDSSPIKLDASPFRERPPLMELETNQLRRQSRPVDRRPFRNRRKSPKKRSAHDLVLEDEMDQKSALRNRKGAITVYREHENEPFGHPTSMNTLTAEFNPSSQYQQPSFAQQEPQQHLGRPQQHAGQPQQHHAPHAHQQQQQPDFLQAFDFRTMDQLQPPYDSIGFGYQSKYFDGGFGYSAQPFQAFNSPMDLNGGLGGTFANHNPAWMAPNPFQAEEADFKPQAEEVDDERTITAPATPNT